MSLRDEARPLRTVLFCAGDQPADVERGFLSGADSIVIDLEEPRTPFTEADARGGPGPGAGIPRRRATDRAARVRPRAAAIHGSDVEGSAGRHRGPPRRASSCPRSRGPPTSTPPMHCSGAWRSRPGCPMGSHRHLPDPRDGAGAPPGLRDRHRVGPGCLHGRRRLPLRRHPPGPRVPVDGGRSRDAVPALEGPRRRPGRRHPLPDQRDVGRRSRRRGRPPRPGARSCASSATTG